MSENVHVSIAVIGAGTMGSGIAQLAAAHGHSTVMIDTDAATLGRGLELVRKNLAREESKGRMTAAARDAALGRLTHSVNLANCADCAVVIEAISESLPAKAELFRALERVVTQDAILATNTSSLSIGAIAGTCQWSQRVLGLHFFNPAPLMKLVEVVPGLLTDLQTTGRATQLAKSWGKDVIVTKDTPGFIVNRVARPFYAEALRIAEEGVSFSIIDASMRAIGFKMGPFELMDLIGNDVNYAVTCAVFEAFYFDGRYRPSILQRRFVENNLLGRKTARGFYDYRTAGAGPDDATDLNLAISDRILAMLINEAVEALRLQIAQAHEIDTAMTLGVNYPKGLLRWCDEIGAATIVARLDALRARYGEERYRASPLLRDIAAGIGTLF